MIFYYIRHGQPNYEINCLTETGKKQALLLSRRPDLRDVDAVFSSPSRRAVQTAMPTANMLGKEITILDKCDEECAWQRFSQATPEGNRWFYQNDEGIRALATAQDEGKEWWNAPLFGEKVGENVRWYCDFADEFMLSLGFSHDRVTNSYKCTGAKYKKVALFAHEGAGYAVLSAITDIPYPSLTRIYNYHTGVTTIEFDEEKEIIVPEILSFSDVRHLPFDMTTR